MLNSQEAHENTILNETSESRGNSTEAQVKPIQHPRHVTSDFVFVSKQDTHTFKSTEQ